MGKFPVVIPENAQIRAHVQGGTLWHIHIQTTLSVPGHQAHGILCMGGGGR
jgi:hypothetical protein